MTRRRKQPDSAVGIQPSPLTALQDIGQSPWLDNIHRGLLTSGELARMIAAGDVTGLTSNPSIFEQAIANSAAYDDGFAALVHAGKSPEAIVDTLMLEDVCTAADLFMPVYTRTHRSDGYVSIEVAPRLAHDTAGTIREVRRIWRAARRPNVMVKVPATPAGVPAIEEAIADGINVNVTLIFSLGRYREVMAAHLRGLVRRLDAGKRIDQIASVASFFVSRVDGKIDTLLDGKIRQIAFADRPALERLRGKAAIANAKVAYAAFREHVAGSEFAAVMRAGGRPQRPLWASTSTKNPSYPDIYYVEALVGPDTVDTMPPATLAAYRDHGYPEDRLGLSLDRANSVLAHLADLRIDLDAITRQLETEGVDAFVHSYDSLLAVAGARRAAELINARGARTIAREIKAIERVEAAATAAEVGPRLARRDPTLWRSDDVAAQREIAARLGWLDVTRDIRAQLDDLRTFAAECRAAGFTHALLLGMGGSSLAPEVLRKCLGIARGSLDLAVLDSTTPAAVLAAESASDPRRTLYIVSSKSGGTAEVSAFFRFFWERVARVSPDRPGDHFVAITDPGTSLAALARAHGFRRVFENRPDIGGRYSALSLFGMVPAALMGHDLDRLLDRADRMLLACGPHVPLRHNPGLQLGLTLGALAQTGRDKITTVIPDRFASLGDWLEQLVAESSGKAGRGLIPVIQEPLGPPKLYGADRVFVHLSPGGRPERALSTLAKAGHPTVRLALGDAYDVAAEFIRWEVATAVACWVLDVNPFDQPDVQATKDQTGALLAAVARDGTLPPSAPPSIPGTPAFAAEIARFLRPLKAGAYVAISAFLAPGTRRGRELGDLRVALRKRYGVATTVGIGPRFLHSTGQLHKGGPSRVQVIQLTADDVVDVPIPGEAYTFGTLKAAQAMGDALALQATGRLVLPVHLGRAIDTGLAAITAVVARTPRAPAKTAIPKARRPTAKATRKAAPKSKSRVR